MTSLMQFVRSFSIVAVSGLLAACASHGAAKATAADDDASDASAGADACARPAAVSGLVAANYDPSCRTYADCMAINTETIDCQARCNCATEAAVNVSAAAAVQADYARALAQCRPASCSEVPVGCGACYPTLVTCAAGRCAVVPCDGSTRNCVGIPGACSPSCSADEVCTKHECRPLCAPDKPCTGGTKCNDATLCLPPPGCELPDGGIANGGCSTVCYGFCE